MYAQILSFFVYSSSLILFLHVCSYVSAIRYPPTHISFIFFLCPFRFFQTENIFYTLLFFLFLFFCRFKMENWKRKEKYKTVSLSTILFMGEFHLIKVLKWSRTKGAKHLENTNTSGLYVQPFVGRKNSHVLHESS